jgi:hypothetical protein
LEDGGVGVAERLESGVQRQRADRVAGGRQRHGETLAQRRRPVRRELVQVERCIRVHDRPSIGRHPAAQLLAQRHGPSLDEIRVETRHGSRL